MNLTTVLTQIPAYLRRNPKYAAIALEAVQYLKGHPEAIDTLYLIVQAVQLMSTKDTK